MSHDECRLIRLPQVLERVGLSRSAIYAMIKAGEFPKPIKLTARAAAWVEADVSARIRRRIKLQ